MKYFFLYSILLTYTNISYALSIKGVVHKTASCKKSKNAMVWLSKPALDYTDRKLLMHTEVPDGGSFEFYALPGEYELRGSDQHGCAYREIISVKDKTIVTKVEVGESK